MGNSVNNEVIQPFQNASSVINKYNQAIQHNSLTQQGWERLLAQSDDSLKAYLTSVKGSTASVTAYNVSLQGSVTGFKKVSSAITQYNTLSASGAVEQSTFATAVSVTNTRLGTYLTGLNGANASLGGYIISLVGATAKTIILKAATIALNTAVTMGASLIVSGIVSAISEWIHKTENMISASEDAVKKIKSINEELKNNQKITSDVAKRYAELAQGVDQLTGKNISLNNEDYEEFLSLSNQLAEMFPTLSRNYNSNGDAIIQLRGNVDTIVGSLQNLIEVQRDLTNRQIVDELPTVFDGVVAKSNAYEQELSDLKSKRDALVNLLGDVQSEEFSANFMDGFANKWIEISGDNLEIISQMRDDYVKILKDANVDYEELTPTYEMKDGVEVPVGFTIKINSSDKDVEKAKTVIDTQIEGLAKQYEDSIKDLNEEINTANENNKTNWTSLSNSVYAWLSTDDSFKVMDDTTQATVQNIINSLEWRSLDFSSWEEVKQYIQDNILSLFNTADGKEVLADTQVMFGIQTQFNNGDITVEQYQDKLQEFLSSIENLPPETKKSIMLLFGIETNEDGATTSSVDTMIANVKDKLKGTEFDNRVGKLNLGDLQIAADLEVPDNSIQSWDDLLKRIQKVKDSTLDDETTRPFAEYTNTLGETVQLTKDQFAELFDLPNTEKNPFDGLIDSTKEFSKALSSCKKQISSVADAINEYKKNGELSIETVLDLVEENENYGNALKFTKDRVKLNEECLKNEALAYLEVLKAQLEEQSNLDSLVESKKNEALTRYATALSTMEESDSITINEKLAATDLIKFTEDDIKKLYKNLKKVSDDANKKKNVIASIMESIRNDSFLSKSDKATDKSTTPKTNTNYYNPYEDFIEAKEYALKKFTKEDERLNNIFDKAINQDNEDIINSVNEKLGANSSAYSTSLKTAISEASAQIQSVLDELYSISPELKGKSADEILGSPDVLTSIKKSFDDKIIDAENSENKTLEDSLTQAQSKFEGLTSSLSSLVDKQEEWNKSLFDIDTEQLERVKTIYDELSRKREFKIDQLSKTRGTENEQIKLLQEGMADDHKMAEELRAKRYEEGSSEIQGYQEAYLDKQNKIKTLQKQVFENFIEDIKLLFYDKGF